MNNKLSQLALLVFGPAGSGKGTQVALLEEKLPLVKIEAGAIVRERIKQGDKLGKEIEEITKSGQRLSDELITRLIEEAINHVPEDAPIVLDGYPRSPGQAVLAEEMLQRLGRTILVSLWIRVSDDEARRRLLKRSVCQKGHVFIGRDIKVCPQDGTVVSPRYDDTEEAILNRLKWYHDEIVPAIDYFKDKSIFLEINGEQSIEAVHQEIIHKLQKAVPEMFKGEVK